MFYEEYETYFFYQIIDRVFNGQVIGMILPAITVVLYWE